MQLIESSNIFHRLEQDTHSMTAIRTNIQASGYNISRMRELFLGDAILVSLKMNETRLSVQYIPIKQFLSINKTLYIILDQYFSGNTLQHYFAYKGFDAKKYEFIRILAMLIDSQSELLPTRINPRHLLHDNGHILILPQNWSRSINAYESEQSLSEGLEQINFPDEKNIRQKQLQVYALANSLYFMLSYNWPITVNDIRFQNRLKRRRLGRPIEILLPRIPNEIADWFYLALKMEQDECSTVLKNLAIFGSELSAPTSDKVPARVVSWHKRMKGEHLQIKIQKKANFIVAMSTMITVLFIIGTIAIRQATQKLVITGLEAEEVLQGFYESYNELDHNFMSEATHKNTGRVKITQISTIYAIAAIRKGTERREIFISAPKWLAEPEELREPLSENIVFGITDLFVTLNEETEMEVKFAVSYTIWSSEGNSLNSNSIHENVHLKKFRRGWKITSFQ